MLQRLFVHNFAEPEGPIPTRRSVIFRSLLGIGPSGSANLRMHQVCEHQTGGLDPPVHRGKERCETRQECYGVRR